MNYNKGNTEWGAEGASLTRDRFYHDPRAPVATDISDRVHVHLTEKEEKYRKYQGWRQEVREKWGRKGTLKIFKRLLVQMTFPGWCPDRHGHHGSCSEQAITATLLSSRSRDLESGAAPRGSQRDQPTPLSPVGRNPSYGLVKSFINQYLPTL